MCNPRRIQVSTSQQLDQAWEREVTRRIEVRDQVTGEARARQNLANSVGRPALMALENVLAAESSGWTRTERGFRRDVEGGYVFYDIDDQALEIVATVSAELTVLGEASETLSGRIAGTFEGRGEGVHYDDNYGGKTAEDARKEAAANAARDVETRVQRERQRLMEEAERGVAQQVEGEARRRAEEKLRRDGAARRDQLQAEARAHLQTVGLRARREFNRALAVAYRDAIQAYAAQHGAAGWTCKEDEQGLEIEFRVTR